MAETVKRRGYQVRAKFKPNIEESQFFHKADAERRVEWLKTHAADKLDGEPEIVPIDIEVPSRTRR